MKRTPPLGKISRSSFLPSLQTRTTRVDVQCLSPSLRIDLSVFELRRCQRHPEDASVVEFVKVFDDLIELYDCQPCYLGYALAAGTPILDELTHVKCDVTIKDAWGPYA